MGPPPVVSEDFSQTEKMTALEKDILNGSCVFSCQRITISKPEENTVNLNVPGNGWCLASFAFILNCPFGLHPVPHWERQIPGNGKQAMYYCGIFR